MTMPIDPTSATSVPLGDTASSSDTTGMASLLAPDTFLNLLVDELKYQDPLNPTSSSDFMDQVAELSQVEQLQSVSSASSLSEAEGMIGTTVTGDDASGTLVTGLVTAVTNTSNGPVLDVNGDTIAVSSVQQISLESSPTSSADSSNAGSATDGSTGASS